MENVSLGSLAPLPSQEFREMQAGQKRAGIGEDSACWKSRVSSLYWIINMLCFAVLILHRLSVSRLIIFLLIFWGQKRFSLVSVSDVICHQWGQREHTVCTLINYTGCFWPCKHAYFLLPCMESDILQNLALPQLNLLQDYHWLGMKHLASYAQTESVQHRYTENKIKASERSLYFTYMNFPVQKFTYIWRTWK